MMSEKNKEIDMKKEEERRRAKEEAGWSAYGRTRKKNPARGLPLGSGGRRKPYGK